MDPTLRAMLNAVIAEPEQDHLRLICADRFEELEAGDICPRCNGNGEEEYMVYRDGDYEIDVRNCYQCNGTGGTSNKLARRATFIRKQCENPSSQWPDFKYGLSVVWRRGFIADVTCTMAEWEQHGPVICARHPVERVVITDKEPYVYTDPPGTRVYTWYRTIGSASRHCVRPEIFDCHGITKKFPSSEESYDWLSRRCIETARAKSAALSAV